MNTYPDPMRDIYEADAPPTLPARATPWWTLFLLWAVAGYLLAFGAARAFGQTTQATTQPTVNIGRYPVAAFFQPPRNFDLLKDANVSVLFGPESENQGAMTPAQLLAADMAWLAKSEAMGFKVVIKRAPTLPSIPAHVIGFCLEVDEPNGRNRTAADLKANYDQLRALDPTKPIFLSLAGDKISSANFDRAWEKQAYVDFAAVADVLTVNFYSANRNAIRYPMTMTGDIVAKLARATNRPVWFWAEMNDQVVLPLPKPSEGVSRAPTALEIVQTWDYAVAQGAAGGGWFATSQSGRYRWPDSYWPTIDRDGNSISEQLATVKAIGARYVPATQPAPSTRPADPDIAALRIDIADLKTAVDDLKFQNEKLKAQSDAATAFIDVIRRAAATQPTTQRTQ